jgi:hypothetical protein
MGGIIARGDMSGEGEGKLPLVKDQGRRFGSSIFEDRSPSYPEKIFLGLSIWASV